MRCVRVGDRSVLVELDSTEEAAEVYEHARAAGVVAHDIVPGARTVLFVDADDPDRLVGEVGTWKTVARSDRDQPGEVIEVPTRYDGADLELVARHWGMTVPEVISTHTAIEHRVAFCGFSPGFAYCVGLPDHLSVPRLADPRPRVPVGSVAVAGTFTGVYPNPSPGGWLLLGTTEVDLWDLDRDPPALLAPGRRIRFVAVEP